MRTLLVFSATVFVIAADFNADGIQGILDVHNTLRATIAKGQYTAKTDKKPQAKNMRRIVWSNDLQASAQAYTNTCPSGHSGKAGVGENIFWSMTSGDLGDLNQYGLKAGQAWQKEFQDHGWSTELLTMDLFNTGIGHATQMAWANTSEVGCGVKHCPDPSWNKVTVVCQYKAQGNFLGQNIYDDGTTCSSCPSGTSCETSTGLCK